MLKGKSVKHEHHANAAEEGETANIKQNTTNKGFFRGRRLGWTESRPRRVMPGTDSPKRARSRYRQVGLPLVGTEAPRSVRNLTRVQEFLRTRTQKSKRLLPD